MWTPPTRPLWMCCGPVTEVSRTSCGGLTLRKGFPVLVHPLSWVAWWAGEAPQGSTRGSHGTLAPCSPARRHFRSFPECPVLSVGVANPVFYNGCRWPEAAGIPWEGLRGFAGCHLDHHAVLALCALCPVTGVPLLCGEHGECQALGSGPEIQPWLLGF